MIGIILEDTTKEKTQVVTKTSSFLNTILKPSWAKENDSNHEWTLEQKSRVYVKFQSKIEEIKNYLKTMGNKATYVRTEF